MRKLTFLGLAFGLIILLAGCCAPTLFPAEKIEAAYLNLGASSFSKGIMTTEGNILVIPYSFLQNGLVYEVIAPLAEPLVLEKSPSPPEGLYQPKPRFTMYGGEILRYKGETRKTPQGSSYLFEVETTGVLKWSPTAWEPYCRYGYWLCKGEIYARRFKLELPEVWISTSFTRPEEEYSRWEDYFQAEVWLGDTTGVRVDFGDPMLLPVEKGMCPQLDQKLCQDA